VTRSIRRRRGRALASLDTTIEESLSHGLRATATQVYIHPEECIDCGACVPACTSDAIFPMDEVPADKQHAIAAAEAWFAAR
jgi:NAD-dependent dihydropyrimidine dehydrogenase PreA subunit